MDEARSPHSAASGFGKSSGTTEGGGTPHTSLVLASGLAANAGVERLAIAFERSARRWEMVAYPAMVVFTLLALFGFYKIYTVSENMRVVAQELQPQMDVHLSRLTATMETLTLNISMMARNIETMQQQVGEMSKDTRQIAARMQRLDSMDQQIAEMNRSMQVMTQHTDMMRWNMATMNNSIQRPMNFVNRFMPW